MLRNILLITLAVFVNIGLAQGQLITKVNVVPYTVDCDVEATLGEATQCSEGMLRGYFLRNIDTLACPPTDTSQHISVVMDVDEKGSYSVKVRSRKLRASCLSYFEEKGFEMPQKMDIYPAILNKKEVAFKKRINLFYPPFDATSSDNLSSDSLSYKVVDEMPRYDGCEEMLGGPADKSACSNNLMLRYIYGNLKYPRSARENDVEGMVVVQFVVNEEGYLEDVKVVKDIGGNCGAAALKVVKSMNKLKKPPFIPGKIKGNAVKVNYNMPIRFKLR